MIPVIHVNQPSPELKHTEKIHFITQNPLIELGDTYFSDEMSSSLTTDVEVSNVTYVFSVDSVSVTCGTGDFRRSSSDEYTSVYSVAARTYWMGGGEMLRFPPLPSVDLLPL